MASDTHFTALADLVLQARALPPEEQESYLKNACAGDPDLYTAALRLAQIPTAAADRLEHLNPYTALAEQPLLEPGNIFGKYRIARQLATGGMSTVYLAENTRSHHPVAIKFLNPKGLIFSRNEHEILGGLSHDYIARLFDSDVTDDGIPYLVLEYVEGQPLSEYCESQRLSLDERLTLFILICDGVQHAHSAPVVHRDLKPNNILVTKGRVPKILDFGIARSLPPDMKDATLTQEQPMTLLFASPEQVLRKRSGIASDIYSLGVILCALITGRLPYRVRSLGELYTAIPTQAATRPSELLDEAPDDNPSGELRYPYLGPTPPSGDTRRLKPRLAGDLDAIVLKALRKEPEKRYQTVAELASDVQHFLSGQPVSAHKGSRWYRASKLWQRRRWSIVGVGVFLFALVTLALFWFRESQVAAQQRDLAKAQARQAEEVTQFLIQLFDRSSPWSETGPPQTPEQLVDTAALRLTTNAHIPPQLRGRLLTALAAIHIRLGSYPKAEPLLRTALILHKSDAKSQGLELAQTLNALGALRQYQGRFNEAESLYRQALPVFRQYSSEDLEPLVSCLNNLSSLKIRQGEMAEGEQIAREALALCDAYPKQIGDHRDTTLRLISNALQNQDRFDEAEVMLKQVIALRQKEFGPRHPSTALVLSDLATLAHDKGDHLEEERLHREALVIMEERVPVTNPQLLSIKDNLAGALAHLNRLDEAESLHRSALEARRQVLGETHPMVGLSINNLANVVVQDKSRLAEAADLFGQALPILRASYGPESREVSVCLNNRAATLALLGRYEEADAVYKEALAVSMRSFGEDALDTALTTKSYGNLKLKQEKYSEAKMLLERARDILRTKNPTNQLDIAHAEVLLGAALVGLEEFAAAERIMVPAFEVMKAKELRKRRRVEALKHLANLYDRRGDHVNEQYYRSLLKSEESEN